MRDLREDFNISTIYSRSDAFSFVGITIQISTAEISFIICKMIAFAVNFCLTTVTQVKFQQTCTSFSWILS